MSSPVHVVHPMKHVMFFDGSACLNVIVSKYQSCTCVDVTIILLYINIVYNGSRVTLQNDIGHIAPFTLGTLL